MEKSVLCVFDMTLTERGLKDFPKHINLPIKFPIVINS